MSDLKITDGDDTDSFQLDAALAREAALVETIRELSNRVVAGDGREAALREELADKHEELSAVLGREACAEQRNVAFQEAAIDVISNLGEFCCGLQSQSDIDYITEQLDKLAALIKPTESGASE